MKLAIFDFDGTLLMTDTLPALGNEWLRQKRSRTRYIMTYLSLTPCLVLYKLRLLSRDRFRHLAVAGFNNLFRKMSREEVSDFLAAAYNGLAAWFNPNVLNELKDCIAKGYHCVLLSGAYADLLQIVGEQLRFSQVVGSPMNFKNGVFEHSKNPDIIEGEVKLDHLKLCVPWDKVDLSGSRSYGNSYLDLPVMEIVGEPVAVNPDPQLLKHAVNNGWRIIP